MGPFEMVVAIVFIVTVGGIISKRRDGRANPLHRDGEEAISVSEYKQLESELKAMKERVAVLERIATDHDKTIALDREIEALRDR